MLQYSKTSLTEYKNQLGILPSFRERDFVSCARNYFHGRTQNVLAISGLRGTGKTVGLLQAAEEKDTLYLCSQKGEPEIAEDYIRAIQRSDAKNIIVDEYIWIREKDRLAEFLYTEVQNGRRAAVTGTESFAIDMLNYGVLIHRADVKHVTRFSYPEYLRLWGKEDGKQSVEQYLTNGGVFPDYALTNFDTMQAYVRSAIIEPLAGYTGKDPGYSAQLVYTLLYLAVTDSTVDHLPLKVQNHAPVQNFLSDLGVSTEQTVPPEQFRADVRRTAQLLEQIGVFCIIPNWNVESRNRERYYIVNPSLTCQLILAAYREPVVSRDILGRVFEACVLTSMDSLRSTEDRVYSYESNRNGVRRELDGILLRNHREADLVECKLETAPNLWENATIRSKDLYHAVEKKVPDAEIVPYVVYTGEKKTRSFGSETVLFCPFSALDELTNGTFTVQKTGIREFYDAVNLEHPEWDAILNESRNHSYLNLTIDDILITIDFAKQEISARNADGMELSTRELSERLEPLWAFWEDNPPFDLPKEIDGRDYDD